jgi:TPR repeat protein
MEVVMLKYLTLILCLSSTFAFAVPKKIGDMEGGKEILIWKALDCPETVDFDLIKTDELEKLESKGLEIFIKYAKADHISFQEQLAVYYIFDTTEYAKGYYWALKGAHRGNAKSMRLLAHCYAEGKGIPQNDHQGGKWIVLAAAFGDDTAKRILADEWNGEVKDLLKEGKRLAIEWISEHNDIYQRIIEGD